MAEILCTLSIDGKGTPSGPGADTYVSFEAYESAQQQDLVTGGNTAVLECYDDWPAGINSRFRPNDWGTGPSNGITVRAAAGQGHGGDPDVGFDINYQGTSEGGGVLIEQDYVTLEDLRSTGITTASNQSCNFRNLICTSTVSNTTIVKLNNDCTVENCLIYSAYRACDFRNPTNVIFRNCTIVAVSGASYGLMCNNGVGNGCEVSNCVVVGFTTSDIYQLSDTMRNNASADTSAGDGTAGVTGVSVVDGVDFVSPSTNDYNPTETGKLAGAGTTPPLLSDDIVGNTRNDPDDIGVYALVVAGGAILSQHTTTAVDATTATIGCTTDTSGGTLYWYLSTSGVAPSPADLKAGTGSVQFGNLVPTAGQETVDLTGLTSSTEYWHYWIQETT